MKKVVVFMILLFPLVVMAADTSDLQKDVQIYTLAKQNMELQMQVLQRDYPVILEKLKTAEKALKEAEETKMKTLHDAAEKAKKKKNKE